MPKPAPLRRIYALCTLAMACAVTLSGCSVLEKLPRSAPPASYPDIEESDTQQTDRTEAPGADDSTSFSSPTAPEQPTWGLDEAKAFLGGQVDDRLTLSEAWRLAVAHDPELQAAVSSLAAAQTESRIGRAALLPQVQAGYSRSNITGLQRNFGALGVTEGDLDYDSTSAYIQLRQPLFNVDRYAQFKRGKALVELGEAEFALRQYEAAMRLANGYLDVVAAKGRLDLNRALADSLEEQAAAQEALFELNEGDRVDAQETAARLAIAKADVIKAEDELKVAQRQLEAFIGEVELDVSEVSDLTPNSSTIEGRLIEWLDRATSNNAQIRVAVANVRVADTEVLQAGGRHLPTADLVLALADADSENLDSLSQRSNTFQAGIQVAIPIFSGGYDTANHARTRHILQQSEHELSKAREEVAAEVTRQYTAVSNGLQRISALTSSVSSGEESLHAAREAYRYGVNSNLDVLRRQDSLHEARSQLLEARTEWLKARAALAAAAGEPLSAIFAEMDQSIRSAAAS